MSIDNKNEIDVFRDTPIRYLGKFKTFLNSSFFKSLKY